jgi:hypothetical protein
MRAIFVSVVMDCIRLRNASLADMVIGTFGLVDSFIEVYVEICLVILLINYFCDYKLHLYWLLTEVIIASQKDFLTEYFLTLWTQSFLRS